MRKIGNVALTKTNGWKFIPSSCEILCVHRDFLSNLLQFIFPRLAKKPFRYTYICTIGEDSQKEVFISVYDLNTFTVVKTNPMQTNAG